MTIQFNEELFKKTTVRERQIVALIARGLRTDEIGKELCISRDTVEAHRHKIIRKTGLRNAPQLAIEFYRAGLIYWCAVRQAWTHAEENPAKVA